MPDIFEPPAEDKCGVACSSSLDPARLQIDERNAVTRGSYFL
jgi:hypothetical protein